jgi:LmbE family N-acetylglucosaminyl deacetylase
MQKPILLVIMAHPDDESFAIGGTLALYARRGVEVHDLCATRGEAGSVDLKYLAGYDSIAALREAELSCAAQKLGLAGVDYLGFRDSGMAGSPDNNHPDALSAQPVDAVAARIVRHIRRIRPQVVVTHDPIGGYMHPDHIATHRAAARAFYLAGDAGYASQETPYQPQKLYFHVNPKKYFRLAYQLMKLLSKDSRHFGRNGDIDIVSIIENGDFTTHAHINYKSVIAQAQAASACHASQLGGGPRTRGLLGLIFKLNGPIDHFMRAYPYPTVGLRETDLFEGVTLD